MPHFRLEFGQASFGANHYHDPAQQADLERVKVFEARYCQSIVGVAASLCSLAQCAPFCWAQSLARQSAANASAASPALPAADSSAQALDRLITRIVLEQIPHSYSDTKRWGQTAQRFQGIELRREGWKVETKRKWVSVKHGLWQKSSARLLDPDHQFSAQLENVRALQADRIAFELIIVTPLALDARQSQWVNGVQLYSLSADAEAKIRLAISCEMGIKIDVQKFPPDVLFEPEVKSADLQVEHFAIKHISKVGGGVAQQVTHWAKSQLDEQVAAKEAKIVEKLNRQIAGHKDELRISLSDALASRWKNAFWPHLDDSLKQRAQGQE